MNQAENISPLAQSVLYGMNNGLFDDDIGRAVLRLWQLGLVEPKVAEIIEGRVKRHQHKMAFRQIPFAESRLGRGDMVLGMDVEHGVKKLCVPMQYLNAHSLTVANSGAGKTTKSRFYALQVAANINAVWLFDLRKREWAILKPYFDRMGRDLIVVPGRSMRINPLQVPYQTDPADWIVNVADMLVSVLVLPPRASKLIQTRLFNLYRRFGIFDGGQRYPTLFDLFKDVQSDKAANPQSRMAIIDSLEPVLNSLGPDVLGYRYGWTSHDLAQYCLAFELGGLAEVDKNLLLNALLLSEFISRVAQNHSNVPMNLWICLDEAQRLCAVSNDPASTNAIAQYIGLIRGTGIGLDLSIQSAHGLTPYVLSNTGIKMLGRCGSHGDFTSAGGAMGLSAEQIRYAQHHLTPGRFICQLGEGDFRKPFLCQIPAMTLKPIGSGSGHSSGLGPLKKLSIA